MTRLLRLWFGFSEPVDRRTYFTHGLGLMAFKYAVDAGVTWLVAGRFWTPLDYLNPLWSAREALFRSAAWLGPALVTFALPFIWIGVSMTMRRAVHAGRSPWVALLFFVPVVNYLLMLALSLAPPASKVTWPVAEPPPQVDHRLQSAMLGVAASLGITVLTVLLGVYLRRSYSTGLFLGVPFTIGYISSYIYNRRFPRSVGESIIVGLASVTIAGGALVVFALEGIVCVAMAVPLALVVAWPGALLGRLVAQRSVEPGRGVGAGFAALVAPLLVALEPSPRVPVPRHEVVSVVEIDAPAAVVWRHVVSFPDLPPPEEWVFRAGVAAPTRGRIEGAGVGATRYCDFTTGSFVEPVTAWEEGRLLAFDIIDQAPPMRELSPYREVNPPHLDGYFRATHGAFRLIPLPGGRTRLEGRTSYEVEMFPQVYWTLYADYLVQRIHLRVLRHIQALAQEEQHR
ncbi:MAG TPA: SRPBCC family protein [Gemmatimonadales bacterium]|nr:SRPBCC family protein [Gemmatimonadales bacterium]